MHSSVGDSETRRAVVMETRSTCSYCCAIVEENLILWNITKALYKNMSFSHNLG